jgi:hypothetical protein
LRTRIGRRTQITLRDDQYDLLTHESVCTGLAKAELIRRAIDVVFMPEVRPKVKGFEIKFGAWRDPDAAEVARRVKPGYRRA